jgi:transcriptional regulator with XRE-family HTH domain
MKPFTISGLRSSFPWTDRLIGKLKNREYRDSFVAEGVKNWIARQIRSLREQRKLSQGDLGDLCGKPQSAISRLEDPDYGQMSLQTLLEVASAFDVALSVKFVDYPTFLRETKDASTANMSVASFNESAFSAGEANRISIVFPPVSTGVQQSLELQTPRIGQDFRWMMNATSLSSIQVAGHA